MIFAVRRSTEKRKKRAIVFDGDDLYHYHSALQPIATQLIMGLPPRSSIIFDALQMHIKSVYFPVF